MFKIAIGISVYNNHNNVKNLLNSILALTKFPREEYGIVVCDDGSSDETVYREISQFCKSLNIPCIKNLENKGVAYSWNRLTEYYDSEYMIILNDDTRVIHCSWLNEIIFLLDRNPKVGIVDWRENIIDCNGRFIKTTTSHHDKLPRIKLKPSGPFFAFRKDVWRQIKQPDGSSGFWEDLLAYREELDIAAEFASRGFYTIQLPFYMEHLKSQTFSGNPDARIRTSYSSFISQDEFFGKYYEYSQAEGNSQKPSYFEKIHKIKKMMGMKPSKPEFPTKLEYSRAMFAKKWEDKNLFGSKGSAYLQNMHLGQKTFLRSLP